MGSPAWLRDVLAGVMLAVAAYDLGRLGVARLGVPGPAGRRTERDVDAFHVAMGISMAGMLLGGLTTFGCDAWAVLFACTTVWFVLRLPWAGAVRAVDPPGAGGHRLGHVVSSGAMVYMLLAGSGTGPMGAMSGDGAGPGKLPFLAVLLALLLFAAAVHRADRGLVRGDRRASPAAGPGGGYLELSLVRAGATATTDVAAPSLPSAPVLAPRLAAASQVVMALVMVYMLATMV